MEEIIKVVDRSIVIGFSRGGFDRWCVFIQSPRRGRFAPTDLECFSRLATVGDRYGHQTIYQDFVEIYNQTTAILNQQILDTITGIAKKYGAHKVEMDVWFTVLYATMIAEENKAQAILKKRIKRLGMHQLLVERCSPAFAASFSCGKTARHLSPIMEAMGF